MGAAPLSWLAKIGGDTLKTKAKLLSSAINELYDDGQCKIVAVVDNTADNGKTVLITTDDNKTYSGTIANKKCEFLLPPKTLYTVQKVSSGSAEFTTKVEAGYGDYILVHLDTGYVEVKQGDIVGLDYIKAATADDLKNKVPEANAIKELNSNLESCFQSVSNGKALVASAITDQGIATDATATFEVMANNIRHIERTKKIDFNVWTSNYDITPIFKAPKSGYYNIYIRTSISGLIRVYKKEGEVALMAMDIGANQEKIATVYLSAGNTAAVWIQNSTGAYFSGYTIIPD